MSLPLDTLTLEEPSVKIEDDLFGFKDMVGAVANNVAHRMPRGRYVLGIEGHWGMGKSTFANYLESAVLSIAPSHKIIRFEPWLVGKKASLLPLFFGQLASTIDSLAEPREFFCPLNPWQRRRVLSKLSHRIRQYGGYVSALAGPLGGVATADATGTTAIMAISAKFAGAVSRFFGKSPSIDELKANIEKELDRLAHEDRPPTITVIIDDMDRLEPQEAAEILRLVRAVGDFPLVNYVLCFDRDILCRQVRIGLSVSDGHSYIEKFFQNILTVPPQEPFAIRRYFRSLLQASFPDEMGRTSSDDTDYEYRKGLLFDRWAGRLLSTPRDAKRVYGAVAFGWPHLPAKLDFIDYVWLQLIKLKFNKLYAWAQHYLSEVGSFRDRGQTDQAAAAYEAAQLLRIMSLESGAPDHRLGLGNFLPGLKSLAGSSPKAFDFSANELHKLEQRFRLGSPSHWRQYFAFGIPSYAISDDDIAKFRELSASSSDQTLAFLVALSERPHEHEGHFLDVLLDRLADFPKDAFAPEEANGIAGAFANSMDDLVSPFKANEYFGERQIWRHATRILKHSDPGRFLNLVQTGRSINWLAHVLRDQGFALGLPDGQNPRSEDAWLNHDQTREAIAALIQRLRRIDILELLDKPSPLDLLFFWAQLGDKHELRARIEHAIRDERGFIKSLNAMRSWASSSTSGVHYPLHRDYVEHFMDAASAKQRLLELSQSASAPLDVRSQAQELLNEWTEDRF